MANNRSSIDLLKLVGAKLVSSDVNGRAVNFVMVPVAWNDISVIADKDGQPKSAYLNMNEWETRDNFRRACEERNRDKDGYIAPSHEIAVHYGEEFTAAACAAAEKRLRADAAYMAKNPSDEDIKKEARYAVNNKQRIGYVTPIKPRPATPYSGAAPSAPNMGGYVAPQEEEVEEDLPF